MVGVELTISGASLETLEIVCVCVNVPIIIGSRCVSMTLLEGVEVGMDGVRDNGNTEKVSLHVPVGGSAIEETEQIVSGTVCDDWSNKDGEFPFILANRRGSYKIA
mmetsp:Transcript_29108/g.68446  ORF Transcript_29108/g.68446 Transcript_29108/m.68446 type:complete len:106 (+) Transcript_29108:1145-1462(+)